ncbi:hypothetical protein ACFLT7_03685 [candidate division KSB1 bacterium]
MPWSYSEQLLYGLMMSSKLREFEFYDYKVQAELPDKDYKPPKPIDGQVPDIVATLKDETIIVAVETPTSLADLDSIKTRYLVLANQPGTQFQVVLPKGELGPLQKAAKTWGVKVDQWTEV